MLGGSLGLSKEVPQRDMSRGQNSIEGDHIGLYRVLIKGLLGCTYGVLTMAHIRRRNSLNRVNAFSFSTWTLRASLRDGLGVGV